MPRALTLGNGQFLVCLDEFGFVRDLYYPYVGLENHVSGEKHRIGIQVDNRFSWIDDGSWDITIGYKPETMVGYLVCKNPGLGVSVVMEDIAYNETTVFLRQVDVYNHTDHPLNVKIFFHQVFHISESKKRNTAFYDPTHNLIIHYKGRRVFLVNAVGVMGETIADFTVGAYQFDSKEGSFKDAEDGHLTRNAVEHGSVDSAIQIGGSVEPKEKSRFYYYLCIGHTLDEVFELNEMVMQKTPAGMVHSTESFWQSWLRTCPRNLSLLPKDQKRLFDTSLFILRNHTDNGGAVIASADSAMIEYGKDDYSYMWPRDASFIVSTLCKAGYDEVTKAYFMFCKEVLHADGYLHHRFRSDKSLGSTWHATTSQTEWLKNRILQLPIQEDETASVLIALWQYYETSRDLEFIEQLYKPMIEKMAEFLVSFRDKDTLLPLPSYDLWEEKIGVSTYTCSAVYAGLMAAGKFCELLSKRDRMRKYQQAAKEIREATLKHLFHEETDSFIRMLEATDNGLVPLVTVDASSIYGLWYFGMLELDHPLLERSLVQMRVRLQNPTPLGGYVRYEDDKYFKATNLPNPWIITTLWEAQRILQGSQVSENDLMTVQQVLQWVVNHAYPSGVLAEQLDPYTGESLSATPLVWSHAVYIETVLMYLEQVEMLRNQTQPDQNQLLTMSPVAPISSQ